MDRFLHPEASINPHLSTSYRSHVPYKTASLLKLKAQRHPHQNREKLDQVTVSALSFLALKKPALFQNDIVREHIYALLKSDGLPPSTRMKGSQFQQISILAINLLWASHRQLQQWPMEFMRIYIDDACKNRDWVDHPLCVNFSANIRNRFRTKQIPEDRQVWSAELAGSVEPVEPPIMRFDDSTQTEDIIQVRVIFQYSKNVI